MTSLSLFSEVLEMNIKEMSLLVILLEKYLAEIDPDYLDIKSNIECSINFITDDMYNKFTLNTVTDLAYEIIGIPKEENDE